MLMEQLSRRVNIDEISEELTRKYGIANVPHNAWIALSKNADFVSTQGR